MNFIALSRQRITQVVAQRGFVFNDSNSSGHASTLAHAYAKTGGSEVAFQRQKMPAMKLPQLILAVSRLEHGLSTTRLSNAICDTGFGFGRPDDNEE